MNIIEAIKSGKRFRRLNSCYNTGWHDNFELVGISKDDLIGDDWEIEEEKIEITKSKVLKAFEIARSDNQNKYGQMLRTDIFLKELGFK